MSLIDEALKRARMEAAQRAAEGEGLPYPTIPRHLGPRRRRGWLVPAMVVLAVISGLVIGLLLARSPRGEQQAAGGERLSPARPAISDPRDPRPATSGSGVPDEVSRDPAASDPPRSTPTGTGAAAGGRPTSPRAPRSAVDPPRPSGPPNAPPASAAPPTEPPPLEPAGGPEAKTAPRSPPPVPAQVSPQTTTVTDPDSGVLLVLPEDPGRGSTAPGGPAASSPQEATESFVRQLPLAGGGIELGGIAWSETGPFALLNGRVIGPGSVIDAYTLESIRPGHVVLTGEGRRIRLSLQ